MHTIPDGYFRVCGSINQINSGNKKLNPILPIDLIIFELTRLENVVLHCRLWPCYITVWLMSSAGVMESNRPNRLAKPSYGKMVITIISRLLLCNGPYHFLFISGQYTVKGCGNNNKDYCHFENITVPKHAW